MRHFSFKISTSLPVTEKLFTGLHLCMIRTDKFERPYSISLARQDGLCLRIRSFVYDIAPRTEVGSLLIEQTTTLKDIDTATWVKEFPEGFGTDIRLFALNVTASESQVESGLAIVGHGKEEFLILPGEMPHSIHVQPPFYTDPFKSEFRLSDYARVRLVDIPSSDRMR
jgi:hypothetical protein